MLTRDTIELLRRDSWRYIAARKALEPAKEILGPGKVSVKLLKPEEE